MSRSPVLRSSGLLGLFLLLLLGLPARCPVEGERPRALVAPDRSAHLLDRPYPSDALRDAAGRVELRGFPVAGTALGNLFLRGWLDQVASTTSGFSAVTPVYFRFEARPLVRDRYSGRPGEAVRLVSLDSGHRVPVRTRFVEEAGSDPYLRDGLLVVMPDERAPLRPGERYAAWVSRRVARRADGWRPPAALPRGIAARAAVATVFTVHDGARRLRALRDAADAALAREPGWLRPEAGLREVRALRYEQGETPGGRAATREVVEFADGSTETTFLEAEPEVADLRVDLASGPMRVFQTTIRTVAFRDAGSRPFQSPGLGIVGDTGRTDGRIAFSPSGEPLATPRPQPVRVVVQVPRDTEANALLLWGHGSGGDAYGAVQRTDPANDFPEIRRRLAERGAGVVSSDQPLFGRRFAGVEQGYDDNLTLVNIPNLPAFRDNLRQGAVDQHVLRRFAREALPELLAERGRPEAVAPRRLGVFGHSVGAQITGVAAPLHDRRADGLLLNGTSGFTLHAVLASDLLQLEGTVGEAIFALAGIPVPEDPEPAAVLGALFGVPPDASERIDRFHPLGQPFQLVLDPADPLALAREHAIPTTVFLGEGDTFVPPDGVAWLADASRDGELVECAPSGPFNGHFCLFREERGFRTFERFVDGL